MGYSKTLKATGEYLSHGDNEKIINTQKASAKRELLNKIMKQLECDNDLEIVFNEKNLKDGTVFYEFDLELQINKIGK